MEKNGKREGKNREEVKRSVEYAQSSFQHFPSPPLKEVQALIERHWRDQDALYRRIAEAGWQKFFDSLPDRESAFFTREHVEMAGVAACCSDEGNRKFLNGSGEKMALIRTPGSGILRALDREDKDPFAPSFIDATAKEALEAGVTVFTGHGNADTEKDGGCGAANNVYDERLKHCFARGRREEMHALENEGSNAFAKRWTETVADRMRAIAGERMGDTRAETIRASFITALDRPKEIHIARCLYLTDVDEFDASYPGLPQGFVERTGGKIGTVPFFRPYGRGEKRDCPYFLLRIAFDPSHGFGAKFGEAPEDRFVICCIAKTPGKLRILIAHANHSIRARAADVRKKIRVDGFVKA